MTYELKWHPYGAYKKFSGVVSMQELLRSLSEVQSHPNYDTFRFTITDFVGAQKIEFNESEMLQYGAQVIGGGYVNNKLAVGIVVTDPEVIELLKSRYEPLVRYQVAYFSSLSDCERWVSEKTASTVSF